jgi:hypothetical protein
MENAVRVIDIPPDTTAVQAEDLLNVPYEEGYYLAFVVSWAGLGARAFYKRRVNGAGTSSDKANRDVEDETAKAVIRANDSLTVQALVKKLAARGIKRGKTWVSTARLEAREIDNVRTSS